MNELPGKKIVFVNAISMIRRLAPILRPLRINVQDLHGNVFTWHIWHTKNVLATVHDVCLKFKYSRNNIRRRHEPASTFCITSFRPSPKLPWRSNPPFVSTIFLQMHDLTTWILLWCQLVPDYMMKMVPCLCRVVVQKCYNLEKSHNPFSNISLWTS